MGPLVALLAFLFVLTLGLAYEWFYGNLNWIRTTEDDVPEADASQEAQSDGQ